MLETTAPPSSMFSTKLTRAAPRATAGTSTAYSANLTHRASQCISTVRRPGHQRRNSSSKTSSCPPDSTKPAPAAKASASADDAEAPVSPKATQRSSKGRTRGGGGYRRSNHTATKQAAGALDQFAGLPSVPSVQGWDKKGTSFYIQPAFYNRLSANTFPSDLGLSSFFSLHRPLSITHTIPPPSSQEAFNTIFEARRQDGWENGNSAERRPEDVIYTLHNTIDNLERSASSNQDEGVRWEVIHESPSNADSVKHLDGAPRMKSLEELVTRFKPFRAPPPPQPFSEGEQQTAAQQRQALKKALQKGIRGRRPKQRSYRAEITITESLDEDGQTTYSASSTPIVRIADPESNLPANAVRDPQRPRQSFLTRMRDRQRLSAQSQHRKALSRATEEPRNWVRRAPSPGRLGRMYAISVKRQRKLKMKKHKYKKLMKRTRNLRRRLDRV